MNNEFEQMWAEIKICGTMHYNEEYLILVYYIIKDHNCGAGYFNYNCYIIEKNWKYVTKNIDFETTGSRFVKRIK